MWNIISKINLIPVRPSKMEKRKKINKNNLPVQENNPSSKTDEKQ